MKLSSNQFTYVNARLITAAVLAATLVFASGVIVAAGKNTHEDRVRTENLFLCSACLRPAASVLQANTIAWHQFDFSD